MQFRLKVQNGVFIFFRMITALPVPSVKVFHKTYYQEKGSRIGSSQPGSPLADSEAVVALVDKEPPEYYFCGKVMEKHFIVSIHKKAKAISPPFKTKSKTLFC